MLPGLFRTLIGLVIAWFVFRFLDRLFGGRGRSTPRQSGPAEGRTTRSESPEKAKDDHLGEYVEFEEVKEEEGEQSPTD